MKYDSQKHHRRSIRLKGYDYTQPGAYFITMVTYQRECLFGEVLNGEMQLSPMGRIADEHWRAIPTHFPQAELGAYVIMPNHMHGIIEIRGNETGMVENPPRAGATHWVAPPPNGPKPGSIGAMIGSYKMSVSRRIQRECNTMGVWQRNYYEHIIRDEQEHNRITLYIESNIDNWERDGENPLKSK